MFKKNFFSSSVLNVLAKLGVEVRKVQASYPVDLREKTNDARSWLYYRNRPVVVNAAICDGRREAFALKNGSDPFVAAVMQSVNYKAAKRFESIRATLWDYYSKVQPKDACEWLGVDKLAAPGLNGVPPYCGVLPWENISVDYLKKFMEQYVEIENKAAGQKIGLSAGSNHFGPVSRLKLEVESKRLYSIMESVEKHGYVRGNSKGGDISAFALVSKTGEWRWLCPQGQHRLAVLAGLQHEIMPIRVEGVIFRDHYKIWPNVLSGVFTEKGAIDVFDMKFEGAESPVVRKWICE